MPEQSVLCSGTFLFSADTGRGTAPAFRSKKTKAPGKIFPGGLFLFLQRGRAVHPLLGDTPPGFIA